MKRGVVLEFRTPQHPSLGTNNWGGASPLLARNIPKESLEHKYAKLNSVRTHDEIFRADYDDDYVDDDASKKGRSGRGILMKLLFFRKEKTVTINTATLGSNLKRGRWLLPRLDPQNRWPQGWC